MEFGKSKYFAFFFMLVLLTSGFPLNANTDENILPTADAQVKNNGNKIFFCENNPIKKTEFDKPHMKPQDYMSKCKERTEGYSWGSRIYVLLWAPGFNADSLKLDEIGGDQTGANGLIQINTREGSSSIASASTCNQFIETGRDHGLFYGSIKLSGYKKDVTGDGRNDVFGGNRCESSMGVLDDGALRSEARQDGAITMSFQYDEDNIMHKSATHTWRLAELSFDEDEYVIGDTAKLTMSDLDALRWPFDNKLKYPIHVYSDSDKAGIAIDVSWKPNYRATPQMHGDYPTEIKLVEITQKESSSNYLLNGKGHSELRVSPGDNVYAEYDDYTLPKPHQENDYKQVTTIAKIVEVKSNSLEQEIVKVKDHSPAKQFTFTKYTSNGEYLVSVWWNQWDWWTNQPSAQSDNSLNISIVEGLSEKPVTNVPYTINVLSDGNSIVNQENIYDDLDSINISTIDTNFIEISLSDVGQTTEKLKFKFKIDSDSQPN